MLRDGTASLADAGLSNGEALVLLVPPKLPPPPEPVTTPVSVPMNPAGWWRVPVRRRRV